MEDEASIKEISNEDVQIIEDEVKEDIPIPFDEVKEVESMKVVHPKVGMKFEDQDEMYELWREYGQNIGFPVRRRSSKKDDNGKVAVLGANDEERYKRYKEWGENELRQANVKKPGGGNDQIPKSTEEHKAHKTIDRAEENASANVQDLAHKSRRSRPRVLLLKKRDDGDTQTHQSSEEERENIIADPSQMETQAKKKLKQNKKHVSKETMQESIISIPSSSQASVNNFGPSWRGYPQMQFSPNNQLVNAQKQFWGAYSFGANGIHVYGMPPPYMQHAYGVPRPYLRHAIMTRPPLQKHMQPSQDVVCSEDDVSG